MDGVAIGGPLTVRALHGPGQTQEFDVFGDWQSGTHDVRLTFLNDEYNPGVGDRNLYLDGASFGGAAIAGASASMPSTAATGRFAFSVAPAAPPPAVVLGDGPDTVSLAVSEDAYRGDARYAVTVDGVRVGGIQTAVASHAAGRSQTVQVKGDFGHGVHEVGVTFLNDDWGGTADTDRNLYVSSVLLDGVDTGQSAALLRNGTRTFQVGPAPAPPSASTSAPATEAAPGYYVAVGGDDAADGSAAHPFATLARAKAAMQAGPLHVTYVGGGTYAAASALTLGAADSGVGFFAVPGQTPVIDGGGTATTLLSIDGASGVTVTGLTFRHTAAAAGSATVVLHGASGVTFSGNRIADSGGVGLLLVGSDHNTVSGNLIETSGQSAVEDKDGGSYNLFDSNTISGVGAAETSGGGFYLHGTDHDTVSHNLVRDTRGAGIALVAIGGYNGGQLWARNTGATVSANVLRGTNTGATDSGAIYVIDRTGRDTGTAITGNLVDGARDPAADAHIVGLYFDDFASGITATGNVVRGVQTHAVQFHGGRNIDVEGNVFDLSGRGGAATKSGVLFMSAPADIVPNAGPQSATNDRVAGNILLSDAASPVPYEFLSYPTAPAISGNLYWDAAGGFDVSRDAAPAHGDPRFADAAGGNYALLAGSAAASIGFPAIDQGAMGPHPVGSSWA